MTALELLGMVGVAIAAGTLLTASATLDPAGFIAAMTGTDPATHEPEKEGNR